MLHPVIRRSLALLAVCTSALLFPVRGRSADRFQEFPLEVVFVNGTASTSNEDLDATRIKGWVATAEQMYDTWPRLRIHYSIERQTRAGSVPLADLVFDGDAAFGRFMDEHFDNVARTETEGHLTVLVTESLRIGKDRWGGMAFFPHNVNPFNRKRGIWLGHQDDARKYVLAHELGHFFGLKHTFEPYIGLGEQCNKDFANKNLLDPDLGHCNSCRGRTDVSTGSGGAEYATCQDGISNVMDYCEAAEETLNNCQQDRAAKQRQRYLTKDGKVSYVALAGLRGEGACTADADCEEGEFCTAGVVDLERNVCKARKERGQTCTDRRMCLSDRCSWGACADADECRGTSDCGRGQYCGDPISGKRACKDLLAHGKACTKGAQCASGKCQLFACR